MSNVFKVALPSYNAKTDTNPNHFALYVDNATDFVLIKEKTRNTSTVSNNTVDTIAHGLGYVPLCFVFVEESAGVWRKLFSSPIDSTGYWYEVDDTNLEIHNFSGAEEDFAYYIFYDKTV